MPVKFWRLGLLVLSFNLIASPAKAQLRPLEPAPWAIFDDGSTVSASFGVGLQQDQRASIAGTVGRLLEIGNVQAAWRADRVAIQITGTMLRLFDDEARFTDPASGVDEGSGPHRYDSGDYTIATIIRLNPQREKDLVTLRFGTRLPNSDDRIGIDRDRTDFFALVGGRADRRNFRLAAELGLGVNGSHDANLDQADVLLYNASIRRSFGTFTPTVTFLGRRSGTWILRGNENLSELRVGLNAGRRSWISAEWVYGFATFSPGWGIILSAGFTR